MKIALTVKGAGLGAWLDDDFDHCGHIMIIDENNRFESWPNPYRGDEHDKGKKLAKAIIEEKVDILITGEVTDTLKDIFSRAGIRVEAEKFGAVLELVEQARE